MKAGVHFSGYLQGLHRAIPMFLSQGWVVGGVALLKHLPAIATGAS